MRAAFLMLLVASCGTTRSPADRPTEESHSEAAENLVVGTAGEASQAQAPEPQVPEPQAPEPRVVLDGPRNFLTPHRCHPPGPCTLEFEALRGPQHIDLGNRHTDAPHLDVALRVHSGHADLDGVLVESESREARGVVVGRSRDSLEGGAYYVTLNGDARAATLELSFRPE